MDTKTQRPKTDRSSATMTTSLTMKFPVASGEVGEIKLPYPYSRQDLETCKQHIDIAMRGATDSDGGDPWQGGPGDSR